MIMNYFQFPASRGLSRRGKNIFASSWETSASRELEIVHDHSASMVKNVLDTQMTQWVKIICRPEYHFILKKKLINET